MEELIKGHPIEIPPLSPNAKARKRFALKAEMVSSEKPSDAQVYSYSASEGKMVPTTNPAGVTDHGALTGLTDDDHTIYRLESADHNHTTTGLQGGQLTVAALSDAPAGELGGTWASPTVDATHSGSAHHTRSHAITGTSDHTSTATSGQMLKADANGLPVDATNTDAAVAAAVTASHAAVTASGAHTMSAQDITAVAASDILAAHIEIATDAEVLTGTDTARAVTPAGLKNSHTDQTDPHTGYRLESADHTHQSTGAAAGQLDHGLALTGLTDDDHTQYHKSAGDTGTGAHDFGGADSFEIPNGAAPTVNADGEIALDTTVTGWSHGVPLIFGTEELAIVAMPRANGWNDTPPTDGYVIAYNATADELEFVAQTGGGGDVATDTIWDAAGDLAVGSGADTAVKLTTGAAGTVLIGGTTWSSSPVIGTALILGAATTSGVRLDLESGVMAVREGDDSAYASAVMATLGLSVSPSTTIPLSIAGALTGSAIEITTTASGTGVQVSASRTGSYTALNLGPTVTLNANSQSFKGLSSGVGPNTTTTGLTGLIADALAFTIPATVQASSATVSSTYARIAAVNASPKATAVGTGATGVGTNNVTEMYGFLTGLQLLTTTAAGGTATVTVTDGYGIRIQAPTQSGAGTETLTNYYGTYIEDTTGIVPGTDNYLLEIGGTIPTGGAVEPSLRVIGGGAPGAGVTNIYASVAGTLRRLQIKDGAAIGAGDNVAVFV